MSYNVDIKIFGQVTDPEAIWNLSEAAAAEADEEDFESTLAEAAAKGRALEFSTLGYSEAFEGVTAACQQAGLSYVWTIGEERGDGPTNGVVWKPGLAKEIEFLVNEDTFGLSLELISEAARNGVDEVKLLVSTVAGILNGGKIVLAPGFSEAYEAVVRANSDEEEDMDMAP